jgi:hypothetical protein
MPIVNTTYKREAFLRNIAAHLCGGNDRFGEIDEGGESKTIYFGGGFWRGHWMENEIGVMLFNPDYRPADARIIEEALCLLRCGSYRQP